MGRQPQLCSRGPVEPFWRRLEAILYLRLKLLAPDAPFILEHTTISKLTDSALSWDWTICSGVVWFGPRESPLCCAAILISLQCNRMTTLQGGVTGLVTCTIPR